MEIPCQHFWRPSETSQRPGTWAVSPSSRAKSSLLERFAVTEYIWKPGFLWIIAIHKKRTGWRGCLWCPARFSRNPCLRSLWWLCQALKDLGVLLPQNQNNSRDWLKASQTKARRLQDGATHFWRLSEPELGKVSSPSYSQDNENGRDFEVELVCVLDFDFDCLLRVWARRLTWNNIEFSPC